MRESASVLLTTECIAQHPHFPTGCESVTAVMALQYHGETVSTEDFVSRHLPMSRAFYYQDGQLMGPDPNQYFIGDPREADSYGCFAPVIATALTSYFGSSDRVINATGTPIPELCRCYIDHGLPVILWASIRMEPIKKGTTWTLSNGSSFIWPSGEHCVLLTGYNNEQYFVSDPSEGTVCAYDRKTVEQRYAEIGKQAIVITK